MTSHRGHNHDDLPMTLIECEKQEREYLDAFASLTSPRPSWPGPCPCVCNSGGFCGGCGHAGCAGRRR